MPGPHLQEKSKWGPITGFSDRDGTGPRFQPPGKRRGYPLMMEEKLNTFTIDRH